MPLWGSNDAASNAVFSVPAQLNKTANAGNRTALYGNTTLSAFVNGKVVGQFAASAAEVANTTGEGKKLASTGWHLRTVGTGPITTLTITNGGTGYSNLDLIRVAAPAGGVNASATVLTNGSGVITAVTITNGGSGFITVNPTVSITNTTGGAANGTSGALTSVAGGRAGRVHYECLVSCGITGDGTDDTQLPE